MTTNTEARAKITAQLAAKGIHMIALPTPFPVGPINCYLFLDQGILFDTGMKSEESVALLKESLAKHGTSLRDLKAIVVTHGHRDHMGALGVLQRETDAPVYAHPLVKAQGLDPFEGGEGRKQFYIDIMREFGVPHEIIEEANSLYDRFRTYWDPYDVHHELEDGGEALGFKIHFVPGHSPSDTLFIHEQLGVTVVADHILRNMTVNALLREPRKGEPRAKSLIEYRASLRQSRERNLGICLPGHGHPFDDPVQVIDDLLTKQDERSERILKLVHTGLTTPYAISKRLFPKLENKHLHLGLSMAVGHLEVLEEEGRLRSDDRDGALRFSPE